MLALKPTEGITIEQKLDAIGKPIEGAFVRKGLSEEFNIKQVQMELQQIANQEQMLAKKKAILLDVISKCNELVKDV